MALADGLVYRTYIEKRLFGDIVHLTVEDHLEAADGLLDGRGRG